jgi:rubredoxin
VRGSLDEGAFTLLYLDAGRVVAGLTVGRGHELDAVRELLRSGLNVHARRGELADPATELSDLAGLPVERAGSASAATRAAERGRPAPAKVVTVATGQPDGGTYGPLYICPMCGYIYDPGEGDEVGEIPPSTRFADLPDDWICPVCGTQKVEFEPVEE